MNMKSSTRIDEKLKMAFSDAGMSVVVQSEACENPARGRVSVRGYSDVERMFKVLAEFFQRKDVNTFWKPIGEDENGSFVVEYVHPGGDIEEILAMQGELETMFPDEGARLILPEQSPGSDQAYAPLKYEFYDAIESGEKTVEFREYNEGWAKKLLSRPMKTIKFSRGYGQSGKAPRQMVFAIEKIGIVDAHSETEIPVRHPDGTLVCDGDVDEDFMPTHFAIHLGARLS